MNWIVTILTIGVGVCLLLGFFTRLASLAGALFLLGVIATQPPWVADAAPTINQIIEWPHCWCWPAPAPAAGWASTFSPTPCSAARATPTVPT